MNTKNFQIFWIISFAVLWVTIIGAGVIIILEKDRHVEYQSLDEQRTQQTILTILKLAKDKKFGYPLHNGTSLSFLPPACNSGFGFRWNPREIRAIGGPLLGEHGGIDLQASNGQAVYSCGEGIVLKKGWSPIGGRFIMVDHGDGLVSFYCHLSGYDLTNSIPGTQVGRRTQIGMVGHTGRTSPKGKYGAHLHWEVRYFTVSTPPLFWIAWAAN